MSEEKKNEIVKYEETRVLEGKVDQVSKDISRQIVDVNNKSELDSLYDAFKLNDTKKNVFRINKLNDLLDMVTDEAISRFKGGAWDMSNKEVIDYMNAVQGQIDRAKNTIDNIKDVNAIQVNKVNNTVNVNINNETPTLSRESREKVIDFVKEILTSVDKNDSINKDDVIDVSSSKEGIDGN